MASLEPSTLEAEIDIIEQQQHFCELFGHSSSIIYDCYTTKESLAQKIDLILPQKNEIERNELTTTIWNQNKYLGGNCLFMSPIYITLVSDHKPEVKSKILSKSFQVHPVFRVQKCTTKLPGEGGGNCCAVFIDESGRVYMNWPAFREDNVYADGLFVAPINGIYNAAPENKVQLEFFERKGGITKIIDQSSMVIGLTSAGIAALTLIPALTFAPVVAVGAATAGISCAIYSGIRGIYNLYDRQKHEQTITNADTESSSINLAAGEISAGSAVTTQLLANAAHNSARMTNIIRSTAHALNAGALGLHTTGCLKDIYLMISKLHEFEYLSTIEISHLSALLYLLTHSVKNQETAEQILSLSKAGELIDLNKILRDTQKKEMNRLVHKTMIIQGWDNQKIGQITVRSLKNQIDSQPMLTKSDGEEHAEPDKTNATKESIKKEYLELFESRTKIDDAIREYFDPEFDQELNELIGSDNNISDEKKIAIAVAVEVESVVRKFKDISMVLRETVKDVLLSIPLTASHIFFGIVTKFASKNVAEIQSRLGRFIPIDIFITDIYSLLKKLSIKCEQELEQYLLDYNEGVFEDIEKEICQFYDNQHVVGDSSKCSQCEGFYCN